MEVEQWLSDFQYKKFLFSWKNPYMEPYCKDLSYVKNRVPLEEENEMNSLFLSVLHRELVQEHIINAFYFSDHFPFEPVTSFPNFFIHETD